MVDTVTKCCTKCFRDLPLDRFGKGNRPGTKRGQCNDCRAAYYRGWRRANPELALQYSRDNEARIKADPNRVMLRKVYRAGLKRNKPDKPKRYQRAAFVGQTRAGLVREDHQGWNDD